MAIVSEKIVAPRPFQPLNEHDVRSSEFGIDDMPVLQPHPNSLPPEPTSPRRPRPGSVNRQQPATNEPPRDEATPAASSSRPNATDKTEATALPAPTDQPTPTDDDWGEGIL